MNLFEFILNYKNKKNQIKDRADVADDVTGAKTCLQVAVYKHAMGRTHTHARAHVCVLVCAYVHVCEYVCACVISEIKHPFQDFR